jgi:hypothetical protein
MLWRLRLEEEATPSPLRSLLASLRRSLRLASGSLCPVRHRASGCASNSWVPPRRGQPAHPLSGYRPIARSSHEARTLAVYPQICRTPRASRVCDPRQRDRSRRPDTVGLPRSGAVGRGFRPAPGVPRGWCRTNPVLVSRAPSLFHGDAERGQAFVNPRFQARGEIKRRAQKVLF